MSKDISKKILICLAVSILCTGCTKTVTSENFIETTKEEIKQKETLIAEVETESVAYEESDTELPQYEEGNWRTEGNNTYFDTDSGETIKGRIYRIDGDYYLFDKSGIMQKDCFVDLSYLDKDTVNGGITSNTVVFKLPKNKAYLYFDYEGKQAFEKACIHQYRDNFNHIHSENFWFDETGVSQQEFPKDKEIVYVSKPESDSKNIGFRIADSEAELDKESDSFSGQESSENSLLKESILNQEEISFQTVLEEINSEDNISKYYPGFDSFLKHRTGEVKITQQEVDLLHQIPTEKSILITQEEALADVDLYFRSLEYAYGAYYYFGPDNFKAAEEKIVDELKAFSEISTNQLSDVIYKNMEFIQDGHFYIGDHGLNANTKKYKTYYSLIQFSKDENGYYIGAGEKWYCTNIENKNVSIQKSLADNGKIAYRLIQFCPPAQKEEASRIVVSNGSTSKTIETKWNDTNPHSYIGVGQNPDYKFYENDGIMYVSCRAYDLKLENQLQDYIDSGRKARKARLIIYDIRGNHGGSNHFSREWYRKFTGIEPPIGGAYADWLCALHYLAPTSLGSEHYQYHNKDGLKVNNDIPIVLLVDDHCGSAGEEPIKALRTLKNVVVIGSNSKGCSLSGSGPIYLPNSKLEVKFGPAIQFYYGHDNIDGIGYKPDIWCDPKNAMNMVVEMLQRNNIITEETGKELLEASISNY